MTSVLGYWSDGVLDPHAVENAELSLREDGTGWLYWVSWSGSFLVHRFTWTSTENSLNLRFGVCLSGTWSLDDEKNTVHEVEERESDPRDVTLGYTVDTDGTLTFSEPVLLGLAGTRFARTTPVPDPTR
ncbi:hypothetical protein [Allokutzneria oryzae]|uniref:Uncharacterized protein n=1 Tax=Allokutzneria oryzae TaxID=1378989 RepID=A0ABV5ZTL8_9PSEU